MTLPLFLQNKTTNEKLSHASKSELDWDYQEREEGVNLNKATFETNFAQIKSIKIDHPFSSTEWPPLQMSWLTRLLGARTHHSHLAGRGLFSWALGTAFGSK